MLFSEECSPCQRRSIKLTLGFIFWTLLLACILPLGWANSAQAMDKVLVLYDSTGPDGWLGQLYVQHLDNLLSHFEVQVTSKPVEQYTSGEINGYETTIYLGVIYDNPLPAAFQSDFLASTATVCWLGYNLWQVAWDPSWTYDNPVFTNKFGVSFLKLDFSNWNEVSYKGATLTRDTAAGEIGRLQILDPDKASVLATCHTATKEAPYITHAANLWYVADNPLSYVTMTDRYLAFADVLHDVLHINHLESHRALIRIEDVHPLADPDQLRAIADYLGSEGVPFMVCVIPEYRDPLGVYNGGVPLTVKLSEAPEVVAALRYMRSRGGRIVQHGFTHQYDAVANPYSGVSAEDYEFYRVTLDDQGQQVLQGPVPEDSAAWARNRVGLAALYPGGLEHPPLPGLRGGLRGVCQTLLPVPGSGHLLRHRSRRKRILSGPNGPLHLSERRLWDQADAREPELYRPLESPPESAGGFAAPGGVEPGGSGWLGQLLFPLVPGRELPERIDPRPESPGIQICAGGSLAHGAGAGTAAIGRNDRIMAPLPLFRRT
jgi:uncharacterized protein YdaL